VLPRLVVATVQHGQFFVAVALPGFGDHIAEVDFGGCGIAKVDAPFAAMHCHFLFLLFSDVESPFFTMLIGFLMH